jgi:dUTP pyrophosphatase
MENSLESLKIKTQEFVENIYDAINELLLAPTISTSDSTEFLCDLSTGDISNTMNSYATLLLYVNSSDEELMELYNNHIKSHNDKIISDVFPNSGFDIFVPSETIFEPTYNSKFIDFGIKCEMIYHDVPNKKSNSCGYYIFPRSSISKTPLLLSNHTGIIDAGYRGYLLGAFRNLDANNYVIEKHTRLLQICHPSLCPIYVKIVREDELSKTSRGDGGFGSTGIIGQSK